MGEDFSDIITFAASSRILDICTDCKPEDGACAAEPQDWKQAFWNCFAPLCDTVIKA